MTNRRITLLTVALGALMTLALPMLTTSAQEPWWRRGDNNRRDNRGYGYDYRLRDAIRNVESRSDDFQGALDRALDRSRYDDSRREDNMNGVARQFRDAARRLRSRFNERDPYRSQSEARELIQVGTRIDRFLSRQRLDSRVVSEWNNIRYSLNVIADAYNLRFDDDGYYNRGRNNRRNDDYRRNDRRNDGNWRWPF
jgi:hypothetical protein